MEYQQFESLTQELKPSAAGIGGSIQLTVTAGELIAKIDDTAANSPMLIVIPIAPSRQQDGTTVRGTNST